MKTLNFRTLFARLQAMPHYVSAPNTLSPDEAQEIAEEFGANMADFPKDYKQANDYGQERLTRADMNGNGLGQFHNAARLFFGYIYEEYRVSYADSAASLRNEFQD